MTNILYNPKSTASAVYIPAWLSQVSTNQLTCTAKMIYGRLAQLANQNGKAHQSATQLSEELGIPERSIKRGIKELKECGLIGSYLEVNGGHNHYEFYQHSWMNEPINKKLYKLEFRASSPKPLDELSVHQRVHPYNSVLSHGTNNEVIIS